MGLEKLGKGDWRGISDQFVTTRTPTQVASHAQKYFHRMAHMEGKNRRCSIFDISINERVDSPAPKEQTANESRAESNVNVLAIKQHKENHKNSTETSTLVVASSERPPISPSMRYNASSTYPKMPYMVGPSSSATPTFSFLPMMSTQGAWPPPTFVYQPIQPFCNVKVAPYARPLMVVPASGPNMFPRQLQAAPPSTIVMPITKNDRLDLNVGALTL